MKRYSLMFLMSLLGIWVPSVGATSSYVNTTNQESTGFEDGTINPFISCTVKPPNYGIAYTNNGSRCMKFYWQADGYDGTRDGRGTEGCSGPIPIYKEGWYGFYIYLPAFNLSQINSFPTNTDAGCGQVFQNGYCNSWAAMCVVRSNAFVINHRNFCGSPTSVVLSTNILRDRWTPVVLHFIASTNSSAGKFQVWVDNQAQGSPTYDYTGKFGFSADWNADDTLGADSSLALKFGQYDYDAGNAATNETRTSYYDNVCMIVGNPTNAWNIVNPGVGSPGGLVARNTGSGKITVNWIPVNGAASYNISRALSSAGPYTPLTNVAAASFINTGLTNGVTYYYLVTATNAASESPNSAPVSATPNAGSDTVTWSGNVSGDWDIDFTANWRSNATSFVYLDGDFITFNDSASNATVNLTDTVSPATMTVSNKLFNYTFTSSTGDSISGTTSLTKSGSGSLLLSTPTNYFGGGLTMNAGTIDLCAGNAGAGPVSVFSGVISNGTLSGSSYATVNATVRANLGGVGSTLIVNGSGTTTLSGTNSYTGATTIVPGSTLILSGNNTAATGAITDNGTLQLVTSPTALGASQVVSVANGNTVYLKGDTNTTFTGGGINANFTINFNVDKASAGVSNSTLTLNGPLTWAGSGTLNANGGNSYNLALGDLLGSTATLNANSADLTIHSYRAFGNSSSLTFIGAQNIDVIAGITNAVTKGLSLNFNGNGKVTLWGTDSLTGGGPSTGSGFAVNSGTVVLNNNTAVSGSRGNITVGLVAGTGTDSGAKLLLGGTDVNGLTGGISLSKNIVVQDGGATPNIGPMIIGGQNTGGTNSFSSTITLGATSNLGRSANLIAATGGKVDFNGVIATNGTDTSSLITIGSPGNAGIVRLTAANTYAGGTVVSAGTLLVNNTTSSGTGSGIVVVQSGGTLGGSGIIRGSVTLQSGGTLAPGNSLGTLTVSNTVTLQSGSATLMEINRTSTPNSDKLTANSIVGGGTLTVTNLGSTNFVAGDTFTLFNAAVTGFSSVNLPALPFGKFWINRVAVDGSLVIGAVNTTMTNLVITATGNSLTLSWPADHTGWTLQVQTNSPNSGLGTNWVTVAGSVATNQLNLPVNPASGSVFYRLTYP